MSTENLGTIRRWRLNQLARGAMKARLHGAWAAAHREMGRILGQQQPAPPREAPGRPQGGAESPERERSQPQRRPRRQRGQHRVRRLLRKLSPKQRRLERQRQMRRRQMGQRTPVPVRQDSLTRMLTAARQVQAHGRTVPGRVRPALTPARARPVLRTPLRTPVRRAPVRMPVRAPRAPKLRVR
jgi:hypothetical protein